eukprot:TRINITY_DN614_c0_g1_i3.p1 TRINITY_DN614_c0_g1~~TRINITY_DN614_c0_g1_i3.p1  ORF type:complete len:296 (+),score=44.50 TRINITY_DN614_c0_g1_i3:718-1605(+)
MKEASFVPSPYLYNGKCCQAFLPRGLSRLDCPQRPLSKVVHPNHVRAHVPSPDPSSLLDDLRSGSQPKQLVALVRLTSIPPHEALILLEQSETLTSPNIQVRLTALATLGKLGCRERADVLVNALESDQEHSIRAAAASGLGNLLHPNEGEKAVQGYPYVLKALIRASQNDENFIVRYAALIALGELGNPDAIETVLPIIRSLSAPALEATAAVAAIGKMTDSGGPSPEVFNAVAARASDRDELVRAAVVRTLANWSNIDAVPELLLRMKRDETRYGQSNHVQAILDDVLHDEST